MDGYNKQFMVIIIPPPKKCTYLALLPDGGHILYLFFITGIIRFKDKRVPFL